MKRVFKGIDTAIHGIEDVLSIGSLAGIVGIAFANVIARYVFKSGFLWADEVSQALLVMMGMFGCARAVRANGHTQFDLVQSKLRSQKARIVLRAVIMVVTLAFLVFLFINSAQYTKAGTMLSTVLRLPRMYYYVSIPIGFAFCIYEYLSSFKSRVIEEPEREE